MSTSSQKTANDSIKKAREALEANNHTGAYKYAKIASKLDPNCEDAWLILASISDPKESIAFLNHALELNPKSKKAREGMCWAAKRLKEFQQTETSNKREKVSKEIKQKRKKKTLAERRWGFSLFFTIIFIGTAAMLWMGLPTLQAQASVQNDPRPKNVLPKPTLTPTITPTPTMTPTPTPTQTPTPTPTADTSYSTYYYHSWDIPEEVSGTNDFWIEVDLSAQMLYAYRGNQILNAFLVSTGTSKYPTVTGAYKIYAKLPIYTMIGPGYNLPDVPYVLFFHKGYSIHGTYWHSNFGTPMSHGCVNMHTNDSAWVYSQAGIGTYVFVHY